MSASTHPEESIREEVEVHVDHKPACRVEMRVKSRSALLKEARKNAIKAVGKEISLPGFRKGRAPDELIHKKFPKEVEKQLHKAIADLAFVAAQKIVKVPLLNNNTPISFDLKNISEESAETVFSFETEPKVPSIDPKGFVAAPIQRAEVADKQIEEAIRQMRFFYAQWNLVQDRPIQDGDYIMIDLDTIDGDTVQQVFHHIRFEVSKERMAHWMKNLVRGAKAGDVLEGMSEVDETATEEEKREFTPKKVRLSILKVEEAALPELDDAFAKKVGATDVAQMRESITQILKKQVDDQAERDLREQVNQYLVQNHPFELPQSLIDTEKKHRFHQMQEDPKFKATWQKMSQQERKDLEEKVIRESSEAVRLFYLSRHLVESEKIPITHQEVQNEAISVYQSHAGRNAQIDQMPKEVYALALSKVILAKAQDFVLKRTQEHTPMV